jgi:prepilin-type N-terminal cleavage/methylation domain-containing protein
MTQVGAFGTPTSAMSARGDRRQHRDHHITRQHVRRGFTLVELLVSIAILALLATILLVGIAGVTEVAREDRTTTQIERLHAILALPPALQGANLSPQKRAMQQRYRMHQRLLAIRELMRIEMPDNRDEVFTAPNTNVLATIPSTWYAYQKMAMRLTNTTKPEDAMQKWSSTFEGSECLYLILSRTNDGDTSALSHFSATEIVDTDADGLPEIVDGWGRPILFQRWAPGFAVHPGVDNAWGLQGVDDDRDGTIDNASEAGMGNDIPSPSSLHDRRVVRDEFDPFHVDDRWLGPNGVPITVLAPLDSPFPLFPLIVSGGPDKEYGLYGYSLTNQDGAKMVARRQNPYWVDGQTGFQVGSVQPDSQASIDNIHNHAL